MKFRGIVLRGVGLALLAAVLAGSFMPQPAKALISYPSSDPQLIQKDCYRHVLAPNDFLILIYENTPYTPPPTVVSYREAFVWRLYDVDGTTELAQATGFSYRTLGYGYNLISFYFSAADLATLGIASYPDYWGKTYVIKLSGTFGASTFLIPPNYNYPISPANYSVLTDTGAVKLAIAQRLIEIATDLNSKWGLTTDYELTYSSETGTTLSIYGQAFFRGAIYGVQGMAPSIFPLSITNVNTTDRTWTTTYITDLEAQAAGFYIDDALLAGQGFFDVTYNLMGLLLILMVCAFVVIGHWYLGGGFIWRGMTESAPVLVIGSRMALVPLGELGLVAAICWLYVSAKVWKVI